MRDPEQRGAAREVLSRALDEPVVLGSDPSALSAQGGATHERVARALVDLSAAGIEVTEFNLGQPSLDEVFLALTGHPAEPTTNAEDAA